MFSTQEVQDLFQVWPPKKHGLLPQLVASADGQSLVSARTLDREFKQLVTKATERQALVQVCQILGVNASIVIQLINAHPETALMSRDELTIVPEAQRNHIQSCLEESTSQASVDIDAFTQEYDISKSSMDVLVRSIGDDTLEINNCVLSANYESLLAESLKGSLEGALGKAELVTLQSDDFLGRPPMWLIERVFHNAQKAVELGGEFYVTYRTDSILCTPKQAIIRDKDATLNELRSGDSPLLDLKAFVQRFQKLYESSPLDPAALCHATDAIFIQPNTLVSRRWLTRCGATATAELDNSGFVDCAKMVPSVVPEPLRNAIQDWIIKHLSESEASTVVQIQQFVIDSAKYATEFEILSEFAKAQAVQMWQNSKETPEADLKLQLPEIIAGIPPNNALLHVIANGGAVQASLAERFLTEIATLESASEAEFAVFWKERVVSRTHVYHNGLDAIEEQKLHAQLTELFTNYLQKDLLPDAIAKAGAQGLTRSKKTRKNIYKLETALMGDSKDLTVVLSALDKFGKKQDIPQMDDILVSEAKNIMVADMVRRMNKPKTDGPLFFLTLILVLFAKHYPGIVYATGKFAPKLLKQLKSKISTEDYERAEGWKEAAKAGTLGPEEKEAMRQLVNID